MSKARNRKRRTSPNGFRALLTRRWITVIVVSIVIVAAILVMRSNQQADLDVSLIPDNSVGYAIQDATHITANQPHVAYNSDPPTSGPHTSSVSTDVYQEEVPDEALVHNLEHGHVWYSYRDADDAEVIEALTEIQRDYPRLVVVTYRPQNESRIAASAWGRLLILDNLDTEQLRAFLIRYSNNAPETVSG